MSVITMSDHILLRFNNNDEIKIKLPPVGELKDNVDCLNPAEEDLNKFLKYFFECSSIPSRFSSKFSKMRLCNQIIVYYDMALEFGDAERPTGDLECVLFGKKLQGIIVNFIIIKDAGCIFCTMFRS